MILQYKHNIPTSKIEDSVVLDHGPTAGRTGHLVKVGLTLSEYVKGKRPFPRGKQQQ